MICMVFWMLGDHMLYGIRMNSTQISGFARSCEGCRYENDVRTVITRIPYYWCGFDEARETSGSNSPEHQSVH